MRFRDFYNHIVQRSTEPPVRFELLRAIINEHHAGVGEIKIYPIRYVEPNHQAHFVMTGVDRSSPYDDEFITAEIRYCEALNEDRAELRFSLTKELMHVFDADDERTDTREKFVRLLREIQNEPLPEHASAMFKAELRTKWMALIALCPKPIRDKFYSAYQAKTIESFEVAEALRLPEWVIPYLMDEYYEEALTALLNGD